ncbi:MAG: hypothetical protein ACI9F9_001776 [Candidatus Paceibacteria bacterium]|jgi:hypothetical protein
MILITRGLLFCACALLLAIGSAQAERNDPGSLLIFPEYDSRQGSYTFLTVTNVNTSESVRVHFNYVSGETCLKFDAMETLTPRDTVTFFSRNHSPTEGRGYCFAYARGMSSGSPIDFDFLIASQITLDGTTGSQYQINAMVFEGKTGHGNTTDMDSDGHRDLDGVEYAPAPDRIAIPRFFGQIPGSGQPRAELILIGLTGSKFDTVAGFLIYNDNEEVFSAQHTFDCWDRVPLSTISAAFNNDFLKNATNNDPGEIQGFPAFEAGWFVVNGEVANSTSTSISQPALLATMVEVGRLSSASLPFTIGEQTNGQLLPLTNSGN